MNGLTFQFYKLFRNHYYCLIAGLPDLILNENRKGPSGLQFRIELEEQLSRSDYKLYELIYRPNDNQNLLNLLLKRDREFDISGNYSEEYLKNQIETPTDIEDYMKVLISDFKSELFDKSPLSCENKLQELFYSQVLKVDNDFIRKWFTFDRDLKNVVTAINCKKYEYPPAQYLISDQTGNSLNEILLKGKFNPELFVDEDIPWLEQLLQLTDSSLSPAEKEKAMDNIKWTFLDDLTVFSYFTIEKILSFAIKLSILDRWRKLDDATGRAFLERMIRDLEMSYSFSDAFTMKHQS